MILRAPAAFGFSLAVLAAIVSVPSAQASVVTNGDFETGAIAPWEGGTFNVSNSGSYAGTYHAFGDLQEFDTFRQLLATEAGHIYDISFVFRTNLAHPVGSPLHLFWDGTEVQTINAVTTWTVFAIAGLTADSIATNLLFQARRAPGFGFASAGYHFDNVVVEDVTPAAATPLPAALPLFAAGLGALGLLGWRRKRKVN
jgi:hypothetical protein